MGEWEGTSGFLLFQLTRTPSVKCTHVLRTGIFSYNGKITLTVNMDVNIPGADAKALAKCWDAAFIALYNEICEYTVLLLNLFFPFLAAKVYA